MDKIFYTVEEYANLKEISEKKAYEETKDDNFGQVDISHKTPKLIYEKKAFEKAVIISLMNQKGGCGKTSLSVHLAIMLATLGFKTLLIDTDPQNQCRLFFDEEKPDNTLREALAEEVSIEECIYTRTTKKAQINFLSSSESLGTFLYQTKYDDEDGISKILAPVTNKYDFIIFDTSPYFGVINVSVARASNCILVPITPTTMHIEGMAKNFEDLEIIAQVPSENIKGVILSIVNLKEKEQELNIIELENEYKDFLFPIQIPESAYLRRLAAFRTNIFDHNEKSEPSQNLKKTTWHILKRI